jgi:hypothetical protein
MGLPFLCEKTCLILPILPFSTAEENKLFDRLIREQIRKSGAFDEEQMALDWVSH